MYAIRSYYEFNGGEGAIGESYLALWKIEDLIALNEAYVVQNFAVITSYSIHYTKLYEIK